MTTQRSLVLTILALGLGVMACSLPMFDASAPPAAATLGLLYTRAAHTLTAAAAQTGAPDASATTTASPTVSATSTPQQAVTALCDAADFVRDVSVPDGAVMEPRETFTKTWRLRNAGTCTWTGAYALVFVSGDRMSGSDSVGLPRSVAPGETIDLSVELAAPRNNGAYQGYWRLRNASGAHFGIGAGGQGAFWVAVHVDGPTFTAYDFARSFCEAEWTNANRDLPCPGSDGDGKGYVIEIEDVELENGKTQDDPGLLTVPRNAYNGSIAGTYPAVRVRDGDHFQARVNCAHGASSCNVIFSLYYQIGGGPTQTLGHWNEAYEGKFYTIDLDLSSLAGNNVKFTLAVSTNGPFQQDRAIWVGPRIARGGTPPGTDTPSPSPTATPSPTSTPTASETPTASATASPTETATATGSP